MPSPHNGEISVMKVIYILEYKESVYVAIQSNSMRDLTDLILQLISD